MDQVFEKQTESAPHLAFGLPNRRPFQVKVTLKAWLKVQGAGVSSRLSPRSKKLDHRAGGRFLHLSESPRLIRKLNEVKSRVPGNFPKVFAISLKFPETGPKIFSSAPSGRGSNCA